MGILSLTDQLWNIEWIFEKLYHTYRFLVFCSNHFSPRIGLSQFCWRLQPLIFTGFTYMFHVKRIFIDHLIMRRCSLYYANIFIFRRNLRKRRIVSRDQKCLKRQVSSCVCICVCVCDLEVCRTVWVHFFKYIFWSFSFSLVVSHVMGLVLQRRTGTHTQEHTHTHWAYYY